MQSLRLYLCLSILPILFSSCDLLLGVDNSATPLNVYNGMFELLRNNYAYQSEMPEPLDTIYNRYIDRVKTLKDDEKKTLAQILTDVVGDIQDGHVFLSNLGADNLQLKWPPYNIYPPPEQGDPGYDEYQKANEQYIKESQYPNIRGTIKILGEPYGFRYGYVIARADIGYIQPTALFSEGGFSGTGRLQGNDWKTKIDEILAELKNRGVNKMILDLRSRIGGSQYNAAVIAARFLRERRNYMHSYDLIGPADKPGSYRKITHGIGHIGESFSGKVVVLVNRHTGSGGEIFLLAARQIPDLTVMGTRTAGLPGMITAYDLPQKGWQITMTSSRTTGMDGKSYLRVGLEPDKLVYDDASDTIDQILESAMKEF